MEKITCEVVKDLLPLYCDDVCSSDSRKLVEEHLHVCVSCRELLGKMKTECCVADAKERRDEEIVKNMASAWKTSVMHGFLKGIAVTLCVCLFLAGAYYVLVRVPSVAVSDENIEANVEGISDTHIEIRLTVTDGKKAPLCSAEYTADGKYYIIMKRGIIAIKNGSGENLREDFSIPREGTTKDGKKVRIREIYYGTENDGMLIWRED